SGPVSAMPKPILIGSAACAAGARAARARAAKVAGSHADVLRRAMGFLLGALCLRLARVGGSFLRRPMRVQRFCCGEVAAKKALSPSPACSSLSPLPRLRGRVGRGRFRLLGARGESPLPALPRKRGRGRERSARLTFATPALPCPLTGELRGDHLLVGRLPL